MHHNILLTGRLKIKGHRKESKFWRFEHFWLVYDIITITSYAPLRPTRQTLRKTNVLTIVTIRCRNFDNSGRFDYFTLESPKRHTHHNVSYAA